MGDAWRIESRTAEAEAHVGSWPSIDDDPGPRRFARCRPTVTAVVLGSTQPDPVVDRVRADGAGVAVVRRRSGGGAVFVAPTDPLWADVWIPRGDPLWDDDVARSFDWVGAWWTRALVECGVDGVRAHRGTDGACTRWSSLVCFGGVGHGEVLSADGRKLVGLSQRRTRSGAWFTGACYRRWDPRPLLEVLGLEPAERVAAAGGLGAAAVGFNELAGDPAGDRWESLADELVAALPASD